MASDQKKETLQAPLESICHTVSGNMEAMARSFAPMANRVSRANLENVALLSRRARAYLEIPSRAMACRTPQDMLNFQLTFWQEAARHYSEAATRTIAAISGASVPDVAGAQVASGTTNPMALWAGLANPWAAWANVWTATAATERQPRDYISLRDQKAPATELETTPGSGRKAA